MCVTTFNCTKCLETRTRNELLALFRYCLCFCGNFHLEFVFGVFLFYFRTPTFHVSRRYAFLMDGATSTPPPPSPLRPLSASIPTHFYRVLFRSPFVHSRVPTQTSDHPHDSCVCVCSSSALGRRTVRDGSSAMNNMGPRQKIPLKSFCS